MTPNYEIIETNYTEHILSSLYVHDLDYDSYYGISIIEVFDVDDEGTIDVSFNCAKKSGSLVVYYDDMDKNEQDRVQYLINQIVVDILERYIGKEQENE